MKTLGDKRRAARERGQKGHEPHNFRRDGRNHGSRRQARFKDDVSALQSLTGCAQPGAQGGAMVDGAMMRMMRLMRNDLRIHEPGEHEQTDDQDGRQAFLKHDGHITGQPQCAMPPH